MIITFDGESGSGKTTIAREVAKKLGMSYISAGLIFRSFAYLYNSSYGSTENIDKLIADGQLIYKWDGKESKMELFGIDISEELKRETLGTDTSILAAQPEFFNYMAQMVRDIIRKSGIKSLVVDGRSVGKYLFPDADKKFYVTADLSVRAERRTAQLANNEKEILDMLTINMQEMDERDKRDKERHLYPLAKSQDEQEVVNQNKTLIEVIEHTTKIIKGEGSHLPIK